MIRSIISNLPIGRAQADKRYAPSSNHHRGSGPSSLSYDVAKHSTTASDGSTKKAKPLLSSSVLKSIAFFEDHLGASGANTRTDEESVVSSVYTDEPTEAVLFLGSSGDDDSVSVLSFDALPLDSDEMDPVAPNFSKELYTSYVWEQESYSLVVLEQQWFRLAKNSSFSTALYLQGLTEVLHTVRGIFQNHPDEAVYLVINEYKRGYRLDRTNYRKGITACCSDALHAMPANPIFDGE